MDSGGGGLSASFGGGGGGGGGGAGKKSFGSVTNTLRALRPGGFAPNVLSSGLAFEDLNHDFVDAPEWVLPCSYPTAVHTCRQVGRDASKGALKRLGTAARRHTYHSTRRVLMRPHQRERERSLARPSTQLYSQSADEVCVRAGLGRRWTWTLWRRSRR